jgi:serine/threonine-protein kinase
VPAAPPPPDAPPPPGYRIEAEIARGGMSAVYRATRLADGAVVALKTCAPGLRERLRNEHAVAAALADCPRVLPVYEAGDGWLAMRLVDGSDLLRMAPLAPARAAALLAQAADALDFAHARGVVHRDVKPGNVLVGAGDRAWLTDWGLAKPIDDDPGRTPEGNWLGTVDYAAPEQIRGLPVDARADVYALGGVLYWALSARVPYPRASDEEKMRAHLDDPPPALEDHPALAAVIARAMAKDPAERFASACELARAALTAAR